MEREFEATFTWTMSKKMMVKGKNREEALKNANALQDSFPTSSGEYLDDSMNVTIEEETED